MAARSAPLTIDRMAMYDLTNLRPGPADRALRAKPDPAFPDVSSPNRIQVVAVMLSFGPKPTGVQLDWQIRVKETFDFVALAAMVR